MPRPRSSWPRERKGHRPFTYDREDSPYPAEPGVAKRVMRGGSFLCAENFCTNYRVAGRSHSTPDTGLNNVGFRCVKDAEPKE